MDTRRPRVAKLSPADKVGLEALSFGVISSTSLSCRLSGPSKLFRRAGTGDGSVGCNRGDGGVESGRGMANPACLRNL